LDNHRYTTNIPLARTRLTTIASKLAASGQEDTATEIRNIVENLMIRRPGARRAPSTRNNVTPAITTKVKDLLRNTDMPQEEIARQFNIDGGRVSEIYRQLRNYTYGSAHRHRRGRLRGPLRNMLGARGRCVRCLRRRHQTPSRRRFRGSNHLPLGR